MRLVELTLMAKNLGILRNIKFNSEGMNLIVDNSDKSGNNVGKTTVLKLIDICLGAREKKYIYEENETKAENSELKNYIENEKITVALKLRKNNADTELKVELFERGKRFINGEVFKYETYTTKLKELFFGNNLKKPSFRQLIGKFIRVDQKQDNNRFIKYINAGVSTKEYEAIYSFLFNLQDQNKINYLSNIKKDIKDTENDIKTIKRMYNFKTINELNQIVFVLDNDKQRLNEQIKEYICVEESREFEKERIKLKEKYQKFLEAEENLEFAIKRAKEIIENEKTKNQKNKIDESVLKLLYDEVARNYNGLDKEFGELIIFNNKLSANKINFYSKIKTNKQKELAMLIENKEKFFNENKEKLQDVKIKNFEEYYKIKSEFDEIVKKRSILSEVIEKTTNLEEKLKNLNNEIIENDVSKEKNITKEHSNIFNKYFSKYSERVENQKLIMYFSKENIPTISNINEGIGTGTKKTLISIFDLAYYSFIKELGLNFPEFIIHDVLETSQTESLERIVDIVRETKVQYIAAVLNEKIKDNRNISPEDIVLTLNKNDKLFKI